jgi:hypothetical protein
MQLAFSFLWTIAWWAIAWSHVPVLSEYSFFPLWLGYIASINAMSQLLFKDSLLKKMGWSFVWLFVLSIPLWWFFEYLNTIVQNWHYLYRPISELHYVIQSSVDFSTVVPAVLSAAVLFGRLMPKSLVSKTMRISKVTPFICVAIALVSFILMPVRPDLLFPFVWIAPLLVIDPINYWLGFPSVLGKLGNGQWRQVVTIALAGLFTGFWWEMWNFWSYPKWFYTIPYVGFWKVFEMPLLGYGGYLPFALIIWSYAILVFSLFNAKKIIDTIDSYGIK